MPFQSRTFSGGGFTRRDLDLRKELALLRELEAQAAAKEQETRLADPYEAAKASETARQFMTRRDVRESLPPSVSGQPPLQAPSRTSPGASLMQSLPAALRKIQRVEPDAPVQPRIRTFKSAPTMTSQREEAEAVRDPNFATAYRGREAEARLHPSVMAAEAYAAAKAPSGSQTTSAYSDERATRALASVDEIVGKVNSMSTGYGAAALRNLPQTQARHMSGLLDTLKANIFANELTAMREASKTGGAVGNVSDREGGRLESALGALDQLQDVDQIKEQLSIVRDSIERWNDARRGGPRAGGGNTNTGVRVGQTVTLKNGQRVTVTAVNSDGTFDY